MKDFVSFFNLFFNRLVKPFSLAGQKILFLTPGFIKNKLFSADLKLTSLYLLTTVLLINYFLPRKETSQAKLEVARWPLSVKKHLQLSKSFFNNGQLDEAQLEVEKGKKLYFFLKTVDFTKKTELEIQKTVKLVSQPEQIKQQIEQEKEILKSKPSSRDTHLKLSLLYYQLWQNKEAKKAWQKAFYLDPNNKTVQQIGKLLEKDKD